MIVKTAEFVTSVSVASNYAEVSEKYASKEICVVGRSNVGKSSFINMLANRNKLAKTSSTPGRTRLINLFSFNDNQFMLVDLPGYGYAAASKTEKSKWGDMIEGYLLNTTKLLRVFVLVDSRHEPTVLDKQMIDYLYYYTLPFTVVATKTDKLSKNELARNIQTIATALKVGRDNIIPVSSQTKRGREEVLTAIESLLND